jgi:pyruvate dehydrogenase E2 component (dihydrolipoamide acetyltransferase)
VRNSEVQIARLLPLSLTFDHAALDGAQAAEWLRLLVSMIEDPRDSLKEDGA